jgi:hypothetical protein
MLASTLVVEFRDQPAAHRLVNIASDPFLDLVAAEERCMEEEGLERRIRPRYAVWGDVLG